MNKQELRGLMRVYRPKPDEHWVNTLRFWSVLQNAGTIFCFLPLPDEPDTTALIRWLLGNGKRVCIPRCKNQNGEMDAVLLSGKTDIVDALGIPSADGAVLSPAEIDLALVPGLAFDATGNRLGRGRGFYDRFLSDSFSGVTCGICPTMRFLPRVPAELHDLPVDFVFTPYGLYKPMISR